MSYAHKNGIQSFAIFYYMWLALAALVMARAKSKGNTSGISK